MFKAVIFDMDGVIADSEPIHVQAEKDLFRPYGVELSDEELQRFMGFGIEPMLQKLVKTYNVPVQSDALYARHKVVLLERMKNGLQPVPGATDLVLSLHAGNVPLGLATSCFREMALLVVRKFGIEACFKVVVTVEDIAKSKPDPEIFLKAAERLGFAPGECLAIEDSANGVRAAKAAGMACIGFRNEHCGLQDIGGADAVVDDLRKIDDAMLRSFGFMPDTGASTKISNG